MLKDEAFQENIKITKQDIELANELTFPLLGHGDLPEGVQDELYKTIEFYNSRL